jgi:hypothetical protein
MFMERPQYIFINDHKKIIADNKGLGQENAVDQK